METKPNYFIIFPTYLMDELSPIDCIMMGLLISLAKKDGYAYPSNKMLEGFFKCSTNTIQRVLTNLEDKGFIKRDIIRDDNNQVEERRIYPLAALQPPPPIFEATLPPDMGIPLPLNLGLPSPQKWGIDIYKDITIKKDSNKDIDNIFDVCWNYYGKRGNKKTSQVALRQLKKEDLKILIAHLPLYIDNHKVNDKMQYLPHFTTYIRQRRFEDIMPYISTKQDLTKTLNWD